MPATRTALLVALGLLLATALAGSQAAAHDVVGAGVTVAPAPAPAVESFRSVRDYEAVAVPVRLRIPALHVDTPLQIVGRDPSGAIGVPVSSTVAAWFNEGPRPGQPGPAVIVGHVDSVKGPGVFFRLGELPPGAAVYVDRADGGTARFTVTAVSRVPKTDFPTDKVYLPTLQPSLQLVTCGGSFDHGRRSYRDNVIVYSVPA
jgi:sortase (surface protein transpeptidase)